MQWFLAPFDPFLLSHNRKVFPVKITLVLLRCVRWRTPVDGVTGIGSSRYSPRTVSIRARGVNLWFIFFLLRCLHLLPAHLVISPRMHDPALETALLDYLSDDAWSDTSATNQISCFCAARYTRVMQIRACLRDPTVMCEDPALRTVLVMMNSELDTNMICSPRPQRVSGKHPQSKIPRCLANTLGDISAANWDMYVSWKICERCAD